VKEVIVMNNKLYKDMDESTYNSLNKILNYDKKFILLSTRRSNVLCEELDKISEINNIRLIKYLLVISLDKDINIGFRALQHLKKILTSLKIKELMYFAEFFRGSYYYSIDSNFEKTYRNILLNNDKRLIDRYDEEAQYLYTALTLHSNGYIREKALRSLEDFNSEFKVKFIMLRINDWVKEIRALASKELRELISPKYIDALIKCLPIIDRMSNWGRDNHLELIKQLELFIKNINNYELLVEIYKNSDERSVRRLAFTYLLDMKPTSELSKEFGLKSYDVVILRKTIDKINSIINEDNIELFYNVLKKNKNVICKIEAINLLEKMNKSSYQDDLIPYLFDKSYSVRDHARYKLKKIGIVEFRNYYLRELNRNNYSTMIILKGICETGKREDVKEIVKFLDCEDVRIRILTLNSICKLCPQNSIDYILDKIISDDTLESKNARVCLENNISLLNSDTIIELIELEGYKEHVYYNLIKLTNRLQKWEAIVVLLKVITMLGINYVEIINEEIEIWVKSFNRSFIKPSKEQVIIIRKLYMIQSYNISTSNIRELESVLETISSF
jgi:hypothetical protein